MSDGGLTAAEIIATLTRARRSHRLGRAPLAARLGCARNTVLRWEFRRCSPSLDTAIEWAAVLGYRIALIPIVQPCASSNIRKGSPDCEQPESSEGA
ncbi:helix-turn-helix domain-containing protein [Actinomadura madurae]|uniref:helix-turn-helix domain-containing protein n=1 Tax=Actinomadura madurae TaxID=1993 RepID=UPI0020D21688|nr:helix-turn-helix transcriptional regulator [Actinomadura madurae]MCP9947336.1 helix-turn-helix domain-containing protein [Actinomadura madurae]MCP9964102.1 helix-turn-helix domain-containing protein [Actinomadura madurae]MCP9976573.1 helix-turn-helix domain-containing protein [Actinomadura madurae]MCQ0011929.1 helix-turn-helix domain-containing protein [Actinomadura madurae]MCQ0012769.1 helix-turn-helix domain-containing protein [Actinomadura madurae]